MKKWKTALVTALYMCVLPCTVIQAGETSHTAYEVFVRSFYDSNGDGTGDLPGLLAQLDVISDGIPCSGDDLGCDMLWTMPVFPSPTYHKYDVTDYLAIDPAYGTMDDFQALLDACHERGMRWILDLPVNHTSTQHPWFQAAAAFLKELPEGQQPSADACPYVDYYHFSQKPGSGLTQLDGTSWYYEAQFWEGMPDLNLDSAAVRDELREILAFWLEKGIDGFRLDAVTSYYTADKTASIDFTKWLTDTARSISPDCYLVGEAWTDQNTYTEFYQSGIDSMFDFAFSGAEGVIAKTANGKKDAVWYAQSMEKEEAMIAKYPEAVNAPFYTNHDMARGAGYYPNDDGSRTKLALGLHLMMPGNAFLYYGEELGMKGSGKDENKRAPMYWSSDPQAEGMCSAPPDMDEFAMKFPSWEEQLADDTSILSYVRSAIRIRQQFPSVAQGQTSVVSEISGEDVCAFIRNMKDVPDTANAPAAASTLVVINTSEEARQIDLDLPQLSSFTALSAELETGCDRADLEGRILTLPPFGIAVLQ